MYKRQSEYTYKVDNLYNGEPKNNGGLRYDYDLSQLDVHALLPDTEIILSDRDTQGVVKDISSCDSSFQYEGNH